MKITAGYRHNWMLLHKIAQPKTLLAALLMFCFCATKAMAAAVLQQLDFTALAGDRVEMRLQFEGAPPNPRSYTIDDPARITLDLFDVTSALNSRYHSLGNGNARSVTVLETQDRTRLVINLAEMVTYSTRIEGQSLYVVLGAGGTGFAESASFDGDDDIAQQSFGAVDPRTRSVADIDFRRGQQGEGRVEITLSSPDVEIDVQQQGTSVLVTLPNAVIPERLQRRLDVIDFATPVQLIDALPQGQGTRIAIDAAGIYDYLAYQADSKLVLDFKPVTASEAEQRRKEMFPYSGEKLSLNFQDIEVRSVLQLIADFTDLNLVASDNVTGRITLRLQNVPWDQALDLILKTKGLDKRQIGNVLMVAPADEIANRERLELENSRQVAELAPLQTEFVQVNYAKAADIAGLLSAEQGLLSSRGSVSVDTRTNTLLVQDTAGKLDDIRGALTFLDVPVRQVIIEARIVIASTDFARQLGVQWGGSFSNTRGSTTIGGDGSAVNQTGAVGLLANDMVVDFGVSNATSGISLGLISDQGTLGLRLSALESDGLSEVVSQPKLVTADGKMARIESGVEIPYQEASSSGATSVSFKDAVLALEVTPQITPDDRVIMDLIVKKDSVGEIFAGVPSIDTREIQTQVLVENGETIVLGGIYELESIDSVSKTPFLGDLPYLGRLFKRTEKSESKTELLIFITPRLVKETFSVR